MVCARGCWVVVILLIPTLSPRPVSRLFHSSAEVPPSCYGRRNYRFRGGLGRCAAGTAGAVLARRVVYEEVLRIQQQTKVEVKFWPRTT